MDIWLLPHAGRLEGEVRDWKQDNLLEQLVLVNDLDAMFVSLFGGILADGGEVGVHHQGWRRRMLDVAGPAIAVDLE